jgi:23S rRNA (uracil1939-C5)-methyltransferase
MQLAEQDQLHDKQQQVEARLEQPLSAVLISPKRLGYRARFKMRFDAEGRLGYHQSGSHTHVPVDHCAIAHPLTNALLPRLRGGPVDCTVEFRTDGERIQLDARAPGKQARKPLRQWLQGLDLEDLGIMGLSLNGKRLRGRAHLELEVCGILHRLSPGTFYQVNLEVNQILVDRLRDWVLEKMPARVLDLYAGAGNLSLPLAAHGIALTMIESSRSAVADAKECIKRLGLDVQVEFGDAGRFRAGDHFFDLAILDPPRAGAPGVVDQLLVTRPTAIAYVSCNPSALARDIRPALASGYRIEALELFDMFPQTGHAEILALLQRS